MLHIDSVQLLGNFEETIAIVHKIRSLGILSQRTFRGKINPQRTHLNSMLVFGVVAHAHLHIEGT